jgi:hypothetical protein
MKHGKCGRYREKINAYRVLVGKKPKEGDRLQGLGLDVWNIFKSSLFNMGGACGLD